MTPLFDLRGRVAVVTGASSGLGRTMAEALAAAGARTVLLARRQSALDTAVATIRAAGGEADSVTVDLAARDQLAPAAAQVRRVYGDPDILVNAAGVNLRQPIDQVSFEAWDLHLQLHLGAPFFLSREFAPAMMERGWGKIINLASLQSVRAFPDSAPYGTSKGGIVQLTRAQAQAWSPRGVRVNAIAPGFFPTELTAEVFANAEQAQANARQTMMGRNGMLNDIVGPTVFLASAASDYITGQTLFVDGGFSAK